MTHDVPHIDSPTILHPQHASGTLVLIGGACSPDGMALRAFIDAVEAVGGPIVGITAASADPEGSAKLWMDDFASVGVTDVHFPPVSRIDARVDRETAARIDQAAGVFLGGGDQVKLVATLSGTHTCKAMKALYRRGGVVCGTSAGAAALTTLTMAGGEVDTEGNLVEQYIGPGFGLLGHEAIIDTHFSQRRRLQRLFVVIGGNPQLFGLGLDENTALVVRGEIGEVCGAGGVTFVDGRDSVRFDNAGDLEQGRQLTLSHLRVGIVGTRYHLNLRRRELQILVTGEPSPHVREGVGDGIAVQAG
ncbi:MAG: cyanophycinase [Gemmatimonadetes bacterium]|jgi:cyanophycinase|nr:cyanophycinase [Gemmatimonadota bacterium]